MSGLRWAVAVLVSALTMSVWADDPPKDTRAAEFTRTKKLKGKVSVEAKNQPLKEILDDISLQLQDQKLGPIAAQYDVGISGNQRTTLMVQGVVAEEALDKLFGSLELGYFVVSQENSRYDGWIKIVKGNARGYEPGTEPKTPPPTTKPKPEPKPIPHPEVKPEPKPEEKPVPVPNPATPEEERAATSKLEAAKHLLVEKNDADAKKLLKYVAKFYPNTKAAAEAKKLLDEMM